MQKQQIKYLLFDMDNTLYPCTSDMDAGISKRMMECVQLFYNCSKEEAVKIRAERIGKHSTTLEWLRTEGLTDIEAFLSHVHPENEADELLEQPGLRDLLLSLEYPKSILTNAPHEHSDRVLKKLKVTDLFDSVTDIRDADFKGKPWPNAFLIALKKMGKDATPQNTLFLDDMTKYTDGWNAIGGTAILVGNKNGKPLEKDAAPMAEALKYAEENKITKGITYKLNSIFDLPLWLKSREN